MRKILLAMLLLASAAACGTSPTASASADAAEARLTEVPPMGPPPVCTRYALAGGTRTCLDGQ